MPLPTPLVPECTACPGISCRTQPSRDSRKSHSRWRDFDAHSRRQSSTLWPHPSALGVNGLVGRGLDDLQLHVATEVKRLQMLLASGPLAVPGGDATPMAADYGPSQAFEKRDKLLNDCHPSLQAAPQVVPSKTCSDSEIVKVSVSVVKDKALLKGNSTSDDSDVGEQVVADMGPRVTGWSSDFSMMQESRARHTEAELQLRQLERIDEGARARTPGRPMTPLRRKFRTTVVESHWFELFWVAVVIVNSILIGVQTQHAALHIGEEEPLVLRAIQHAFSFLFLVELLMRVAAFGVCDLFFGSSWAWAWLDLLVVVISMIEFVFDIVISTSQDASVVSTSNIRTMRVVRLARFVRGFRIQRILHLVQGLRTLVFSIAATLKSLIWALLLLFLIMYMVGIMLTQAVVDYLADGDEHGLVALGIRDYWRSLDVTMFTLFQSISGGLSWHESLETLGQVSVVLVWIFTAYIAFTYFAVMNVVTGVFCNSAIESAQRNPDVVAQNLIANRKVYVRNLEKLFMQVDRDDNAMITFSEFEEVISDPQNRAFLAALEIEADDAWTLFKLIDTDRDGVIQKDEFIHGCLQLKGVAKNVEILTLNRDVSRFERKLARFMTKLEECRDILRQSVGKTG